MEALTPQEQEAAARAQRRFARPGAAAAVPVDENSGPPDAAAAVPLDEDSGPPDAAAAVPLDENSGPPDAAAAVFVDDLGRPDAAAAVFVDDLGRPDAAAAVFVDGLGRPDAAAALPDEDPGTRPGVAAAVPAGGGAARALLEAARPRQWLKNALVLAAPAAAGVLGTWPATGNVAVAFLAFCLVASGGYLLNDVRDAPADRRHPRKRARPVASGRLAPGAAVVAGVLALAAGLATGALVSLGLLAVLAGYVALVAAYTLRLRHLPILDLAAISAFFVVRMVGGAVAVDVALSRWFLMVACFGSLFVVAAKRAGEHAQLGPERAATRPALAAYSLAYLRNVRTLAAGVAVTAYCLWAFEPAATQAATPFVELSAIPFVLFVLRYAMLAEEDGGQAPEDVILGDPGLLWAAFAWLALFAVGLAVGL